MPRPITPQVRAALSEDPIFPIILFEATFSSSVLRLWDGYGPLVWNDLTYQGNGWFSGYTPITETQEVRSQNFSVVLSSVPQEVIALVLNEGNQNLPGILYYGLLNSTRQLIVDPDLICEGLLDVPELVEDGSTSSLTLHYEMDYQFLDTPNLTRYTNEEQKRMYPNDKGFEHTANMVNKRFLWGYPSDFPKQR